MMLVSALVLGSHAMHDTFPVIRWSAAGVSPAMLSVLWSESVAAEVIVFFLIGPLLVARLSPTGVMALAAIAGMVRWVAMAVTTNVIVLAMVQDHALMRLEVAHGRGLVFVHERAIARDVGGESAVHRGGPAPMSGS
jgi:PPP family 3-phenylpropionic acid transporter